MTTYYVSSGIGSNNNAGTSESAPLATLQAAANLVQPGDTVEVMNGTYTGSAGGDVLNITTSGTASAPITFEAAPGQTPVINSSGCWQRHQCSGILHQYRRLHLGRRCRQLQLAVSIGRVQHWER